MINQRLTLNLASQFKSVHQGIKAVIPYYKVKAKLQQEPI